MRQPCNIPRKCNHCIHTNVSPVKKNNRHLVSESECPWRCVHLGPLRRNALLLTCKAILCAQYTLDLLGTCGIQMYEYHFSCTACGIVSWMGIVFAFRKGVGMGLWVCMIFHRYNAARHGAQIPSAIRKALQPSKSRSNCWTFSPQEIDYEFWIKIVHLVRHGICQPWNAIHRSHALGFLIVLFELLRSQAIFVMILSYGLRLRDGCTPWVMYHMQQQRQTTHKSSHDPWSHFVITTRTW